MSNYIATITEINFKQTNQHPQNPGKFFMFTNDIYFIAENVEDLESDLEICSTDDDCSD